MTIVLVFHRSNDTLAKSCGCGVCKQNKYDVTHFSSCCLPPPWGSFPHRSRSAMQGHEICKSVKPVTATAPNTVNLSGGCSVPPCTKPIVMSVIFAFSVIDCEGLCVQCHILRCQRYYAEEVNWVVQQLVLLGTKIYVHLCAMCPRTGSAAGSRCCCSACQLFPCCRRSQSDTLERPMLRMRSCASYTFCVCVYLNSKERICCQDAKSKQATKPQKEN